MASVKGGGQNNVVISAHWDAAEVARVKAGLAAAGKACVRQARHDVAQAGKIIKTAIQADTPVGSAANGDKHPGLLLKSTKINVRTLLQVKVYNDAVTVSRKYPGGYRYGKRLEFDPAAGGRAWWYPGLNASKDEAMKVFWQTLEAIRKAFAR